MLIPLLLARAPDEGRRRRARHHGIAEFPNGRDARAQSVQSRSDMTRTSLFAGLLAGSAVCVGAQSPQRPQPQDTSQKTFFTRGDLYKAAAILAVSGIVSVVRRTDRHWTQSESVQSDSRHNTADNLTVVNETPLTLAAVASYGVGRLIHNEPLRTWDSTRRNHWC